MEHWDGKKSKGLERGERTELRAERREACGYGGAKKKRWKMGVIELRQQSTEVEE